MRDVTYSTRQLTVREMELSYLAGKGDISALIEFIQLRSDLRRAEIEVMTWDELEPITTKIVEGMNVATRLAELSKRMQ